MGGSFSGRKKHHCDLPTTHRSHSFSRERVSNRLHLIALLQACRSPRTAPEFLNLNSLFRTLAVHLFVLSGFDTRTGSDSSEIVDVAFHRPGSHRHRRPFYSLVVFGFLVPLLAERLDAVDASRACLTSSLPFSCEFSTAPKPVPLPGYRTIKAAGRWTSLRRRLLANLPS